MKSRMPVLFLGHGSPMNAIAENTYSQTLKKMGENLRAHQPKAAVFFSAHWETDGLQVLTSAEPRTIHDFYGFPRALFEIEYRAPGAPELAERVIELLKHEGTTANTQWGFDHGVWSVMRHLFREADLPIVMVSLAKRLDPEAHFRVGRLLRSLRDEGVLIIGSGNIVHNLREIQWQENAEPTPWAIEFDQRIKRALESHDEPAVIAASRASDTATRKSVPTREHYLPLVPILGATWPDEAPEFFAEEIQNSSIAMRSVIYGN